MSIDNAYLAGPPDCRETIRAGALVAVRRPAARADRRPRAARRFTRCTAAPLRLAFRHLLRSRHRPVGTAS